MAKKLDHVLGIDTESNFSSKTFVRFSDKVNVKSVLNDGEVGFPKYTFFRIGECTIITRTPTNMDKC